MLPRSRLQLSQLSSAATMQVRLSFCPLQALGPVALRLAPYKRDLCPKRLAQQLQWDRAIHLRLAALAPSPSQAIAAVRMWPL